MGVGNLGAEVAPEEDGQLFEHPRLLLVRRRYVAHGWGGHGRHLLQIQFMPLLRRHLALVGEFAAAVEGFLVDNVEHNLGVHIAAGGASAGLGVGIACRFLEIGDGVDGVAVEHGVAAAV